MKKFFYLAMTLEMFFSGINSFAKEKCILAEQWFFSETIADDWQKVIPSDATPFKLKNGKCNLDTIRGKAGQEKDEGVVYNQFDANNDGILSIGLGCDWWMQAFCNGIELVNTMKFGNRINTISHWNYPLQIPVKKGRNLLAVKVIRGNGSFTFACGQIQPPVPKVEPILAPRKLACHKRPISNSGSSYELILLGDTHFDGTRVYHSEFVRNDENWKERGPRLLKAAADQITDKTFGVIQLGDLIEGHYANPQIHSRMLLDALNAFKSEFGALPLLIVAGDHDTDGHGAREVYCQTLLPHLSQELKKEVSSTTFYFMHEEDLYLFIDFDAPDCEVIREAFARHSDARYKFVITHRPVIPADSHDCLTCLFGYGCDTLRRYFREVFLQNDVIVLTAHEHSLELTECMTNSGRITQLLVNSVWDTEKKANYVQIADQPDNYGQKLRTGLKLFESYENSDGVQLLDEYKDAVTRYWKADGAGYFKLNISPEGIIAYYFGGDSRTPSKIIRLR